MNNKECIYLNNIVFCEYISKIALNTNDKQNLRNIIDYIKSVLPQHNNVDSKGNPKFKKISINNKLIQVEGSLNNESIGEVLFYSFSLGEGDNSIINNLLLNKNLSFNEKEEIKKIRLLLKNVKHFDNNKILKNNIYFQKDKENPLGFLYPIKLLLINHNNPKLIEQDIMNLIKKMLILANEIFDVKERKYENNMPVLLHNFLLIFNKNDFFIKNKLPNDIVEILKEIKSKKNTHYKIKELRQIEDIINSILILNGNIEEKINIINIKYFFHQNKIEIPINLKEVFTKKLIKEIKKYQEKIITNYGKNVVFEEIFNENELKNEELYLINNFDFIRNININNLLKNEEEYQNINKNILCFLHQYNSEDKNKDKIMYDNFIDFYNKYMNEESHKQSPNDDYLFLQLQNNFVNLILTNITLVKYIYDNNKNIFTDLFINKNNLFSYSKRINKNSNDKLSLVERNHFNFDFNIFEEMDINFKNIFLKNLLECNNKNQYFYNDCYKYNLKTLNKDFLTILSKDDEIRNNKKYEITNQKENFKKSLFFALDDLIKIKDYDLTLNKNKENLNKINLNILKNNDISLI